MRERVGVVVGVGGAVFGGGVELVVGLGELGRQRGGVDGKLGRRALGARFAPADGDERLRAGLQPLEQPLALQLRRLLLSITSRSRAACWRRSSRAAARSASRSAFHPAASWVCAARSVASAASPSARASCTSCSAAARSVASSDACAAAPAMRSAAEASASARTSSVERAAIRRCCRCCRCSAVSSASAFARRALALGVLLCTHHLELRERDALLGVANRRRDGRRLLFLRPHGRLEVGVLRCGRHRAIVAVEAAGSVTVGASRERRPARWIDDLVAIDAHPLPPPRAHAVAASAPGAASPFATLGGDAAPAT